jgi:putative methanogenesis marker protein 17
MPLDYLKVECPEPVGGQIYEHLASVVLSEYGMSSIIARLHLYVDPTIPIFVAVGMTRTMPGMILIRDFSDVVVHDNGEVVVNIGDEKYLAPLLQQLWDRFGKDRVDQPDRFTIVMKLSPEEQAGFSDLPVVDPADGLYKDLIYVLQIICPEGFKVRTQRFMSGESGRFYFVASENTLPRDIMPIVTEKFDIMGDGR